MPEPDIRSKQYSGDLTHARRRPVSTEVEAVRDLVVEDVETGFCGAVIRVEKTPGGPTVTLEDRLGKQRVFPLGPGFWIDGKPVTLVAPEAVPGPCDTAADRLRAPSRSRRPGPGSRAPAGSTSRADTTPSSSRRSGATTSGSRASWSSTWRASTTWRRSSTASGPGPDARLGVLVDHLVPGTKEARIVEAAMRSPYAEHLLVVGHPYIDVWEAVKPSALGIEAWPRIPRGRPWKEGVCEALGWPVDTPAAWKRILRSVRDFRDLEPELLGRVEELIDFVTGL